MSGVEIGDGAVIACRGVVSKNIPPYAIVGGNPAKIIKMRFEPSKIEDLLDIKWWNWENEKIIKYLPYLLDTDIDKFISLYKSHSI